MSETQHSNMHQRTKEELRQDGVTLLGAGHTEYPDTYNPGVLQSFENKHPERDYVVTFDGYEGTSLCPITHQPDFFKAVISYVPNKRLVESKSMKLYTFSFRNQGAYHEDIANTMCKDIVDLLKPKYCEVRLIFAPRGGYSIYPLATYADPEYPEYVELEKQRKVDTIRDAANRTVRYDM